MIYKPTKTRTNRSSSRSESSKPFRSDPFGRKHPTRSGSTSRFNRAPEVARFDRPDRSFGSDRAQGSEGADRDSSRPSRDFSSSERDSSRPPRDFSRPRRDFDRPNRDSSRPARNFSRSDRDSSRPPRDFDRPRRDFDRPERDASNSTRDFSNSDRSSSRPPRDFDRPRRDFDRPRRDFDRPDRDSSRPPRNFSSSDRDSSRPPRDFSQPRRDFDRVDRDSRPPRDFSRSDRDSSRPPRDFDRPRRDFDRPRRDFDRPDRDASRPPRDYSSTDRDTTTSPSSREYSSSDRDSSRPPRSFDRPRRDFGRPDRGFSRPRRDFGRSDRDSARPTRSFASSENYSSRPPSDRSFDVREARAERSQTRYVDSPSWCYGINPVHEALKAGLARKIIVHALTGNARIEALLKLAAESSVPATTADENFFASVSPRHEDQGIIAQIEVLPDYNINDITHDDRDAGLIVALDEITDPQNLGAIIRSCSAVGANGIILPKKRTASLSPGVHKASAGLSLTFPVVEDENLVQAITQLKKKNWWIVAAHFTEDSGSVFDFEWPAKVVLVMGSEGAGIRHLVAKQCDFHVHIPMHPKVESLNVGTASALLMYQWRVKNGFDFPEEEEEIRLLGDDIEEIEISSEEEFDVLTETIIELQVDTETIAEPEIVPDLENPDSK